MRERGEKDTNESLFYYKEDVKKEKYRILINEGNGKKTNKRNMKKPKPS